MGHFLALISLLAACGDSTIDVPDATPDAEPPPDAIEPSPSRAISPIPPAEAALPVLTPCLPGWAEHALPTGVVVCDPFPTSPRPCSEGFARYPGDGEACQRIGPECPSGSFSTSLPVDRPTLFVLFGAEDGDGSREHPFATLDEALAVANDGSVIAIGRGTYIGPAKITRSIDVIGACATGTVLTTNEPNSPISPTATLTIAGHAEATVRDLTIGATRGLAFRVRDGAEAHVSGVIVRSYRGSAFLVEDAAIDIDRSSVEADFGSRFVRSETRVTRASMLGGYGALTASGGHFFVSKAAFLEGPAGGVIPVGLELHDGVHAEVRESFFASRGDSISLGTSEVILEDVMVRIGRSPLTVSGAAHLDVSRAAFIVWGSALPTLPLSGDSRTTMRDTYVETTFPNDSVGLFLAGEAELDVERVMVVGETRETVQLAQRNVLTGTDLTLAAGAAGVTVHSLDVQPESHADLERVSATGATLGGVLVTGNARLRDLRVTNTGTAAGGASWGVLAAYDGTLDIERASLSLSYSVALIAIGTNVGGATIIGRDVDIDRIAADGAGTNGRGIEADHGATIELTHSRVQRTHDHAVIAHLGSHILLTDVAIDATAQRPCATTTCASTPYGVGVGSYGASEIVLDGFELNASSLCGVHVTEAGQVRLRDGIVSHSALGICIGEEGHDLTDFTDRVSYEGNGENLSSLRLPVPDLLAIPLE